MVDANIKIIAELKLFLETVSNDPDTRRLFTYNDTDFTRDRKLPLERLVCMLINQPKRSLCIELQEFFDYIGASELSCTKAAYSMQRVKLNPIFFAMWNQWLVDNFYCHYGDKVKKWNGFTLLAVDGSTAYLFDKGDIKKHFGTQSNQHVAVPMAQVMQVHDVLNDLTIWGDIYPINKSEQHIMACNIDRLAANSLTLFDRGYPGYTLMYLLLNQESPRHFLMRCRSNFNNAVKDFLLSGKHSEIIELKPNKEAIDQLREHGFIVTKNTCIKVRMVKVTLSTGEEEVLLTDLYDEEIYTLEELKALYFMRWQIETTYSKQKNQQQMEVFSGHKVICVEQDYAAGLFTANLQSLITKQTENYVQQVSVQRKHNYKINRNVSWAAMKNKIVELFLNFDSREILEHLQKKFEKDLEPIRLGRKYPRVKKATRLKGKYQTYTNYRRAI
jgi:hypothetical protein